MPMTPNDPFAHLGKPVTATEAFIRRRFREEQERRAAQREAERAATATAARERLAPLDARLKRVLATIPAEVQAEGLSLPTLQTAFRGRKHGYAHPGEVGAVLRKLGFTRHRRWRGGDDGFSAKWYPPAPRRIPSRKCSQAAALFSMHSDRISKFAATLHDIDDL